MRFLSYRFSEVISKPQFQFLLTRRTIWKFDMESEEYIEWIPENISGRHYINGKYVRTWLIEDLVELDLYLYVNSPFREKVSSQLDWSTDEVSRKCNTCPRHFTMCAIFGCSWKHRKSNTNQGPLT